MAAIPPYRDIPGLARQRPRPADEGVHLFIDDPAVFDYRDRSGMKVDIGLVATSISRDVAGRPRLLRRVVCSRELPRPDYLWDLAKEQGISIAGGAKGHAVGHDQDDILLITKMLTAIVEGPPAVLCLVVGDNLYEPVLDAALLHHWRVELVYFDRETPSAARHLAHSIRELGPHPVHLRPAGGESPRP